MILLNALETGYEYNYCRKIPSLFKTSRHNLSHTLSSPIRTGLYTLLAFVPYAPSRTVTVSNIATLAHKTKGNLSSTFNKSHREQDVYVASVFSHLDASAFRSGINTHTHSGKDSYCIRQIIQTTSRLPQELLGYFTIIALVLHCNLT